MVIAASPVATFVFTPLAPPPAWRSPEALLSLLGTLTSRQRWTLDRLVAQEGKGHGLPRASVRALNVRRLMVPVAVSEHGPWRTCLCCSELWYHIPPEVREAHTAWAAAWEQPERTAIYG